MYNKNDKYNNKKFNNNDRPKPVIISVPLIPDGFTKNGNKYSVSSFYSIFDTLVGDDIFTIISIPVSAEKTVKKDDGSTRTFSKNVGRIIGYDAENDELRIRIFGNGSEYKENEEGYIVSPTVYTKKDSEDVVSIISFNLIKK